MLVAYMFTESAVLQRVHRIVKYFDDVITVTAIVMN